jgi:hypothetical protein
MSLGPRVAVRRPLAAARGGAGGTECLAGWRWIQPAGCGCPVLGSEWLAHTTNEITQ